MTRWYKTPTKILFCLSQEGGTWVNFYWVCDASVADPDLQMGVGGWGEGVGGQSSRPCDNGAWSQKNFFEPFRPQFGLKIRGRGAAPPLDPPLGWSLKTPTAL